MPSINLRALFTLFCVAQTFLSFSAGAAELPERFGSVYRINGSIAAVDAATGGIRELKSGDVLNVGDQVRAAPNGEAIVRTDDAGFIAVRPNAVFTMERFSAKGNDADRLSLRIITGALRLITGWIGSRKKESYQVLTATATIGIRGTDHEPYVLPSELAAELREPEGTYNKVNRGATSLSAAGGRISIDAGQVGFAPSLPVDRTRSLMTVLMPVLLERVPGFFVGGTFDAELERLAYQATPVVPGASGGTAQPGLPPSGQAPDNTAAPQIQQTQTGAPEQRQQSPAAISSSSAQGKAVPVGPSPCRPKETAVAWLDQLDSAVTNRNPQQYVDMFAPQAKVKAEVRAADGSYIEFVFSRNELAKSTFASLNRLTQFESRRISVSATPGSASTTARCNRINIESVVLESGVRDGQPYRIESTEKFTIQSTPDGWLAIDASTKQR